MYIKHFENYNVVIIIMFILSTSASSLGQKLLNSSLTFSLWFSYPVLSDFMENQFW